jgi:hypothetical protein
MTVPLVMIGSILIFESVKSQIAMGMLKLTRYFGPLHMENSSWVKAQRVYIDLVVDILHDRPCSPHLLVSLKRCWSSQDISDSLLVGCVSSRDSDYCKNMGFKQNTSILED